MAVAGDIYHVEERAREIDPALFVAQRADGRYEIRRHGRRHDHLIMTADRLHPDILTELRKADGWNRSIRNRVQDIEYQEYLAAQREEARMDDMAHEFAKDAHRAILHDLGVA